MGLHGPVLPGVCAGSAHIPLHTPLRVEARPAIQPVGRCRGEPGAHRDWLSPAPGKCLVPRPPPPERLGTPSECTRVPLCSEEGSAARCSLGPWDGGRGHPSSLAK